MENSLSKSAKIFDAAFQILLVLLPFTTILSVWTKVELGIPGVSFYKEALLAVMFVLVAWNHYKKRLIWKLSLIDSILVLYILTMLIVSVFTTGIPGILYGGRYDFEFLIAFWIIWHGAPLLAKPVSHYLKLFLISGGAMLFFSGLLKWPLTEDLLLHFGFCGNPSNWQACGGIPPIFHGVEGANVRRFQGILDGPNSMGAFLILFSGVFLYYMRNKKDWYFVTGLILLGLFGMIVYTYSRSALIGIVFFYAILCVLSMGFLYKKYKKNILIMGMIGLVVCGVLFVKFSGRAEAILGREGSTKGHFERMQTSIQRFVGAPLGQGLASSGPAYRYVTKVSAEDMEDKDRFYIPESWFIQQFVEGGVLGGILFILLMGALFLALMKEHIILGAVFAGVTSMNLFLHTFESMVVSLSLFLLIGLFLRKHAKQNRT